LATPTTSPPSIAMTKSLIVQQDSLVLIIDVQERLIPAIGDAEQVIQRCLWLLRLAKTFDVPHLGVEQNPKGLGHLHPEITANLGEECIFAKTTFSAAGEKYVLDSITATGKNQIIVVGMESHVCVLQTVLDMVSHGYEIFVIEDGTSSRKQSDKHLALQRMRHAGAVVISPEMLVFEWLKNSNHKNFRNVLNSFIEK
jgi:nicotinamidase-related amidase